MARLIDADTNYKKEVSNFPCLEYCIEKYNEFMDSFDFLCEVSE